MRLRSSEPRPETKRPRVERDSTTPRASRLESASRSTVRETPRRSMSTRSGGSRSPTCSAPLVTRRRISSVAALTRVCGRASTRSMEGNPPSRSTSVNRITGSGFDRFDGLV